MTIVKADYPVAPTTTPRKGTLLDAATVIEGFKLHDGNDLWQSYNCMKFETNAAFCAPNNKTFGNTAPWIDGIRFAVYGGNVCKALGLDMEEQESEVGRVFAQGESTAVERNLMLTRFVDDPTPSGDRWTAPVDITPGGTAVSPKVGIAMLEAFAANNYVGVPTLHIPIVIGSLVLGVDGAVFEGQVLQTKTGSKVAMGAGYDFPNNGPTGAAAATGEKWLYATGEVVIMRGEMILRPSFDPNTNESYVLAERPYIAAVDCFAAAIRVTVG